MFYIIQSEILIKFPGTVLGIEDKSSKDSAFALTYKKLIF